MKEIESILKNGIMSGEIGLPGEKQIKPEDAETHGCADFFIAPENTNIKTYFNEFIRSFMPSGVKHSEFNFLPKHLRLGTCSYIGFIVDKEKFSKSCPELWKNSATPETLKGSKLENIISHFPDYRYHRAVLVGVPSNYISKIVVGDGVDKDKIASMKALLDKYNLSAKIYDLDENVL